MNESQQKEVPGGPSSSGIGTDAKPGANAAQAERLLFSRRDAASSHHEWGMESDAVNREQDDVIDAIEAGKILKVHAVTVRLQAAAGKIPGRQIGNRWRFSRKRLNDWLQAA